MHEFRGEFITRKSSSPEEPVQRVSQRPQLQPLLRKGSPYPTLSTASTVSERSRMYRETQQLPVLSPLTQVEAIKIESLALRDTFVEMQMRYNRTESVRMNEQMGVPSPRPLSTGKNVQLGVRKLFGRE